MESVTECEGEEEGVTIVPQVTNLHNGMKSGTIH